MSRSRFKASGLTAVAGVAALLAVSACGSDSDGGGGGGGSTDVDVSTEQVAEYQEAAEAWYEGTNVEPSGPAVQPPADKDIWFISIGESVEETSLLTAAGVEAGEKLGWDVTVYDGRFDAGRFLTGVQQAVAQGADGIVLVSLDCAAVQAGVVAAQAANIPVVGIESRDCDPGLLTYVTKFHGGLDFVSFFEQELGKAQADWAIAQTEGAAKVVHLVQTDAENLLAIGRGAANGLEACDTCEVVETVEFVGTDLGPDLQARIQQALTSNPDANVLIAPYDGVLSAGGGEAAVRAAGRSEDIFVVGGVGTTTAVESIEEGTGQDAGAVYAFRYQSLVAIDALIRIFNGQDPEQGVETGIGLQVYDEDHNLPTDGSPYDPPVDFPAAYYAMWGLE